VQFIAGNHWHLVEVQQPQLILAAAANAQRRSGGGSTFVRFARTMLAWQTFSFFYLSVLFADYVTAHNAND
jgi:hypothetical protein